MAASFTMVVSGTIVNVAVPSVIGAFGIGLDQAQLITTGFNIAMVTSQLLSAWLVAAFGQRAGFLLMAAVFTLGSVIGGLGQTFDMVVVGRVLQGVAAGVIQPLVMVVAFQVFPADRRGYAMAIYSMGIFLAVAVGPVFGGFAIELLHWRYIFWAPLPIIFTAALMGWVFMPSVPSKERKAFDWVGYILLIVSVYCLVTAITEGNREGWTSSYIVGLFITGITCGIVLVWTQLQSWSSLIDLTLFKNKQFAMVAFIAFVFGSAISVPGTAYLFSGQLIQGMTPIVAALMMLPSSLLIVAALPFTGKLADRIPAHIGILAGLALLCDRHRANGRCRRQYVVLPDRFLLRREPHGYELHQSVHYERGAADSTAGTTECRRWHGQFLPSIRWFDGVNRMGCVCSISHATPW